jgi:alginate O-acetyltransferase complex protein AlgI
MTNQIYHMVTILLAVLLLWVVAWNLRSVRARQGLLLLASYLFYSTWGIEFLAVLITSSLINFGLGALLRRRPAMGYLWLGIGCNLLFLGFFKYLPPILGSPWTVSWEPDFLRYVVMPVGISFWTFQALSYLFDVYREEEINPSLLEFCLYMAFWPTVLSGPVSRLPDMLPQFRKTPVFSRDNLSIGALRIIQGLFMKLILAQLLGTGLTTGGGITAGFDQMRSGWGGVDVWLLAMGFGLQLFLDFAGYSHLVIGTARLFGIGLTENFSRPFLSATPSIFWTRWHMSLSFWIRDYVFVPLAAARRERWWPYWVFVISMTLFGLWHAAKLTFICWGFYHGLLLVAHRLGQQAKRQFGIKPPNFIGPLLAWAATFASISLGWIFFRANDLREAFTMFRTVLSPSAYQHLAMPSSFYVLIPSLLVAYFAYEGLGTLLSRLQLRTVEVVSPTSSMMLRQGGPESSRTVLAAELCEFFAQRMWWWLTPVMFVLMLFASLAISNQSSVLTVTPFMYAIF